MFEIAKQNAERRSRGFLLKLPGGLHKTLKDLATSKDTTMQYIIVEAIKYALENMENNGQDSAA